MIPKVIHYCWFGGNPIPEQDKEYIASWRKFCPDYEIVEWNESNFDINCNDYVREAYRAKKWAFVSDYARFHILYEHGGVYFDTDVELLKGIDEFVERGPFMGCENDTAVAPGLGLAAEAGDPLYKMILEDYEKSRFLNADGTYDMTTVVERTTRILQENGLKDCRALQQVCGVWIYPKEYLCPMDYLTGKVSVTDKTVAFHHYAASWKTAEEKQIMDKTQKYAKYMGHFLARNLAEFQLALRKGGIRGAFSLVKKKIGGKK